jgi:hypothetical protein
VIVGMFLLGGLTRFLDDVLDVSRDPHAVFLFLLLFPSLVKQEDDWVSMVAGLPGTLLVWLLAVYLTFRSRAVPSLPGPPGPASAGPRRR